MALKIERLSTTGNVASGNLTLTFTGTPQIGNKIITVLGVVATNTPTFTDNASGGSNTYANRHVQNNAGSGFNDARASCDDCTIDRTVDGLVLTGVSSGNTAFGGVALEVSGGISGATGEDISAGSDPSASPASVATGALQNSGELIIGCHNHMPDSRSGSKTLAFGTWTPAAHNFPTQLFLFDNVGAVGIYGMAGYVFGELKTTTACVFTFAVALTSNTCPQLSIAFKRNATNSFKEHSHRPYPFAPGNAK